MLQDATQALLTSSEMYYYTLTVGSTLTTRTSTAHREDSETSVLTTKVVLPLFSTVQSSGVLLLLLLTSLPMECHCSTAVCVPAASRSTS
jgi:hypothetical protein